MNRTVLGIPRRVWCHIGAAAFAFLIVAPVTFMALDREEPVKVTATMFTGELWPGGTARITWIATAIRACPGTVRRRLIDSHGSVFEYDEQAVVIRAEGELGTKTFWREITLPRGIDPGLVFHSVVVRYYCNPLQEWLNWPIVVTRERNTFIVTPRPEAGHGISAGP